ncbi:MAG: hypothetical protein IMZ53_01215 [Thermoplasmata archaeon]|nr:hypothetical protein [Thermoplasmata archaeon]MBE3139183.1 hypothetical protein [Thermoplasmata archaeon]
MKKKCLAVGIILLFLSTTCIPVLASDGKPDLIIEGLGTIPTDIIFDNWVYCVVKNIGSGTANDFIDVKVEIKRVLFGLFLINKTIFNSFANVRTPDGYSPGETVDIYFAIDYQLPSWGFFRIYCWVNPDKRIEEENYDNNFYVQDVFVLFGDWVKALQ